MTALALNPSIVLAPSANGYIAYDTLTNRLHELNPAAALLVELCDGSRSSEDIVGLARPLLPPDSDAAAQQWLTTACVEGVLLDSSEITAAGLREPTANELTERAEKLRDDGSVQAAWLCQQRAAELQPQDAGILRELGELGHIIGRRSEARDAYEAYLELNPDDAEIRHLLTSLRGEAAPARVPTECIQQLYQRFSTFYEDNMLDQLGYEGPKHLRAVIDHALGDRDGLSILDLGCGTGLAGMEVKSRASRLVGVDLSPEMVEQARQRNIYSELHVGEVTQWLRDCDEQFDMILACDTFIYFGDLNQVLRPAVKLLRDAGFVAFSVERSESPGFQLTDNGRYVHHSEHVDDVATAAGLQIIQQQEAFLRMEYGENVTGLFTVLIPDSQA